MIDSDSSILQGMRAELKRLRKHDKTALRHFKCAYNNEQVYRRSKNILPRTDLMVKGLRSNSQDVINGYGEKGFVPHAMETAWSDPVPLSKPHFTRYVDIGYQTGDTGDWYQGKSYWQWIAEVENNSAEIQGTLSDLLRTQAQRKLAVFYADHPNTIAVEWKSKFAEVVQFFANRFTERNQTDYEILVLPEFIDEIDDLIDRTALFSFQFSTSISAEDIKLRLPQKGNPNHSLPR